MKIEYDTSSVNVRISYDMDKFYIETLKIIFKC